MERGEWSLGDLGEYRVGIFQSFIEISILDKIEFIRVAIESFNLQQKKPLHEVSIKLHDELISKIDSPESLGIILLPRGNDKKRRMYK